MRETKFRAWDKKRNGLGNKEVRFLNLPHFSGWNIRQNENQEIIGNIYENRDLIK